jgi:hypothetical protein
LNEAPLDRHLEPEEVAAYVDGTATGEERAAVQAHLAACAECRAEVAEVSRIVRTLPGARRTARRVWIPAVAAAVIALLWVTPRPLREPAVPEHRAETETTTAAPHPVSPVGTVGSVSALAWSPTPGTDRYRVRLFDADGTVLWDEETVDTIAALPDSIDLRAQVPYYWKVEAHTGFDRWASSPLVEFMSGRGSAR